LTKDALAGADDGDWRAAAEAFRAATGTEPSAAQGRRGAAGVARTSQRSSNASRDSRLKGGDRDPIRREAIHEQGERPW